MGAAESCFIKNVSPVGVSNFSSSQGHIDLVPESQLQGKIRPSIRCMAIEELFSRRRDERFHFSRGTIFKYSCMYE